MVENISSYQNLVVYSYHCCFQAMQISYMQDLHICQSCSHTRQCCTVGTDLWVLGNWLQNVCRPFIHLFSKCILIGADHTETYQRMSSPSPHCSKCLPGLSPSPPQWFPNLLQVQDPMSPPGPSALAPARPVCQLQLPTALPCPASGPTQLGPPVGPQLVLALDWAGAASVPLLPPPGWAWMGPGARPCPAEGLKEDNEYSHLRHVILLCILLLLLLLNEQLLLLPASCCSQFFEASLHLLQHLGSVAYHQLHAVLGRLQELHRLLVMLPFNALEARSTDLIPKTLL